MYLRGTTCMPQFLEKRCISSPVRTIYNNTHIRPFVSIVYLTSAVDWRLFWSSLAWPALWYAISCLTENVSKIHVCVTWVFESLHVHPCWFFPRGERIAHMQEAQVTVVHLYFISLNKLHHLIMIMSHYTKLQKIWGEYAKFIGHFYSFLS